MNRERYITGARRSQSALDLRFGRALALIRVAPVVADGSILAGLGDARYDAAVYFEIIGVVRGIETIARGSGIREIERLRKRYGRARWRKRKGIARIRLRDGTVRSAEVHWYEAAGIGKREFKIKNLLE